MSNTLSPHSTMSNLPTSSRRPARFNSSIPMPPRPDFSRRSSALSSASGTPNGGRKGSTMSALGRKKAVQQQQQEQQVPADSKDWARMEPDEVFRRLPVGEVRKVENLLRTEALNKQSELRSMVGTRYRDLLLSTTQITALHSRSLRLSTSLQAIARACANPEESQPVQASLASSVNGDDESSAADAVTQLPLAAHMKLLLDAPEILYSQLAHHNYLHAAFLWLLSRVVKEGVATAGPSESQSIPYLPLLQKQWETLLPFRSQIVQKASASLRERSVHAVTSANTLAYTLLAIILLDSISISEAHALFLSQRMRTVRDILQATRSAALSSISQDRRANQDETKRLLSPAGSRRNSIDRIHGGLRSGSRSVSRVGSRRGSFSDQKPPGRPPRPPRPPMVMRPSISARDAQMERDKTAAVLVEAVKCLVQTMSLVREVFEQRNGGKGESLLEELIRRVQEGEETVQTPKHPTVDTSGPLSSSAKVHQRRASRLASMSMPMPKFPLLQSPSHARRISVVTTSSLLHTLPSAQILLRYLPSSIISFTPFISSAVSANGMSTPVLTDKLSQWHESALSQISSAAPSWLHGIGKVKDVWHIRNVVHAALATLHGGEQEETEVQLLEKTLDIEWARRAKAVWAERLDDIVLRVSHLIEDGVDAVRRGDVNLAQENDPATFLFTTLTFPSAPSSTFASSSAQITAFPAFVAALHKRTTYRTPQLDAALLALETLASDLKADLASIQSTQGDLFTDYEFKMRHACDRIVGTFRKELDAIAKERIGGQGVIESELFVGRLALHLATNSTFVDMLRGGRDDLDLVGFEEALLSTHTASLKRWTSRTASHAAIALLSIFSQSSEDVRALWQGADKPCSPSYYMSVALQSLTVAVRGLGLPPSVEPTAITAVVKDFTARAAGVGDWSLISGDAALQAAVDVALLARLAEAGDQTEALKQIGTQLIADRGLTLNTIEVCVLQYMQRTQVLFAPVFAHLATSSLCSADQKGRRSSATSDSRGSLLRFGGIISDRTAEFRSPLALARTGKRLGLLSAQV